jgi:LmbE family N-acetylglucosaminyl deacetylase
MLIDFMDRTQQQWLHYIQELEKLHRKGALIPSTSCDTQDFQEPDLRDGYDIILCSPHPDDEALTSSLILRLQQTGVYTLNLAITLGSDTDKKTTRLAELKNSCRILDFDTTPVISPLAFPSLTIEEKQDSPETWTEKVNILADHFNRFLPRLVACPHKHDGHPTHSAANELVMEAAQEYSSASGNSLLMVETEFWYPMRAPNLLLGVRPDEAATSIAALSCHKSQISRNPYHLRLPARYMDTVRRGSEICSYGSPAPDFLFGELYRVSCVMNGVRHGAQNTLHVIPPEKGLSLDALDKLYNFSDQTSN